MPRPVFAFARFTPSDTIFSASTSSPESVSSSTANLGPSSSSCRISLRFFSPPENPSLMLRSANAASIRRRAIDSRTSLIHVRTDGASPEIAVFAVEIKLVTVTPGISTGYCIARKIPARARSSTDITSTLSPSSRISPLTTVYFGWPEIVYASVDLPEPLGPIIAWISPSAIARSTPRRISRSPCSVTTFTCRFLISSTDIGSSRFSVHQVSVTSEKFWLVLRARGGVNIHDTFLNRHLVHRHGFVGWQRERLSSGERKPRAVRPTLECVILHKTLGKRNITVGAGITEREHLTRGILDDGNGDTVYDKLGCRILLQFRHHTHALRDHLSSFVVPCLVPP